MKYVKYLLIMFLFFLASNVYAQTSIGVYSWKELTDAVKSKKYNEIVLMEEGTFIADKKITIDKRELSIIPEYGKEIFIIRKDSKKKPFLDVIFELKNNAFFYLGNEDGQIIIDGKLLKEEEVLITNTIINTNASTLYLNNISFENNNTIVKGGAISSTSSTINIQNTSFTNNKGVNGGAIYSNSKCTVNIYNSEFNQNAATNGSGGAIYASGTYDINNTTFTNNIALTYGGAIIIKKNANISNCSFMYNEALSVSGGAIKLDGKLTMSDSKIKNNIAKKQSGGIDYRYGNLVKNDNNDFDDNEAEGKTININPDPKDRKNKKWYSKRETNIKEVNLTKLKSYSGLTQGLVVTDNFILLSKWEKTNEYTKLYVLNKSTCKIINTIIIKNSDTTLSLGHVNDMAYDKNTGYIYSFTYKKNNEGIPIGAKFKIDKKGKLESIEYFDLPISFSSIAYDDDDNYFILIRKHVTYIYDNDFNLVRSFKTPTPLTLQTATYYKGYIYFAAYEAGYRTDNQESFNLKEKSSNLIYMYDLKGNYIKTLYIPNTKIWGELEGMDFLNNGELLLSYNYEGITLFKTDYLIQVKNIDIGNLPKTEYERGEYLSLEGLTMKKTYNNETEEQIIPNNIVPTYFDGNKLGGQTISFIYEGKKYSYDVHVKIKIHLKELMAKAGKKALEPQSELLLIVLFVLTSYYILIKKNKFYTQKK